MVVGDFPPDSNGRRLVAPLDVPRDDRRLQVELCVARGRALDVHCVILRPAALNGVHDGHTERLAGEHLLWAMAEI